MKCLIICGPTATGKTRLAAEIAKEFNGEVISADSRQVYRRVDIGTGKDKPRGVKIWGYDLVEPDEEFSVADFVAFTWSIIERLGRKNKLPIVVGGTGLYLKSLFEPPESLGVKADKKLRKKLGVLDIKQLQEELGRVAPERFRQMNWSDKHNPRRLIRAIEVANYHLRGVHAATSEVKNRRGVIYDALWIGLTADRSMLEKRIRRRVEERAGGGMSVEVKRLMQKYSDWTLPAFSATGYHEWREYLMGKISRQEAIEQWQRSEQQYAARQMTWFKKQPYIYWFDIGDKNWHNKINRLVNKWR
ncbi:MAG: tRNA (adenosine(37)-N6)-dimethylallyltransferase MiaA [Candidatus Chisholmbacteria bacterium]|nr:tRNA (adenosine(37)-N6)-dimethylallyltransferase MiaA [Candidatus Chisholmbacteria bacterium]